MNLKFYLIMNLFFEYEDNNDIVINGVTKAILFSNYIKKGDGCAMCPVPFSPSFIANSLSRNEDTEEFGLDGNWYNVSYFHNGYIMSIERI